MRRGNFSTIGVLALFLALTTVRAYAFPDLVRHGYSQCTACHVSPSGGGILTPYGRQLSAEVLSTWSRPEETSPFYSSEVAKLAEKGFLFGGDIRFAQIHHEDPNITEGKFFLMQAAPEFAFVKDHFTAVVSVGEIVRPESDVFRGNLYSTKYYGLLQITDEWAVRAGRFFPTFGVPFSDHVMVTKKAMRLNPFRQFDTIETNYFLENWSFFLSASQTQPYSAASKQEKLWTGTAAYNFSERYKVGISHWRGKTPTDHRNATAVFGILGFTPRFYNITEVDYITSAGKDSLAGLTQFAYEVFKGFIPYLQYQHSHDNLKDSKTLTRYYGAGLRFFPRPHFEFSFLYERIQNPTDWSTDAYLLGHYYF